MKDQTQSAIELLEALSERAKELSCLYAIEELLKEPGVEMDRLCDGIIEVIPPGWQYPEMCHARIRVEGREYKPEGFEETAWMQSAEIRVQDESLGTVEVFYARAMPEAEEGPFLKEEEKLIQTIADRLGHFLLYRRTQAMFEEWRTESGDLSKNRKADWEAVLDLLRQTDHALFLRFANKMLNHLCWSGIEQAEALRAELTPIQTRQGEHGEGERKLHPPKRNLDFSAEFTERIFRLASEHLSGEEILSRIQIWIQEDKLGSMVQTVHRHLPLSEVTDALRRYYYTANEEADSCNPVSRGLKVSLVRRILSEQLEYINLVKDHVAIEDFYHLLQKVIFSADSHGKLGGKSAGLFLAYQVIRENLETLSDICIPKTWYIASDMMLHFMHYNNIDEIIEQKYKDTKRVRQEYPHVIHTFTQSAFPPDMVKGLSMALDDFGETPLIIRSSSLLEDRMGAAFSGKYKSVILPNQGTKHERLAALEQAVAEIYASIFSPEAIEYRAHRGLLDFSEEMGIMIQELVGTQVGPYFLPAYSGVAQSTNEIRWVSSLDREDGLIRLVPGLGRRETGRTGEGHPVWVAPGRPDLKVNDTVEATVRYAPRQVDVINLEARTRETLDIQDLLKKPGLDIPFLDQILSHHQEGRLDPVPPSASINCDQNDYVVTFDGLIAGSPFILKMRNLLKTLERDLGMPMELEFASNGSRLYLLQCRPQTYLRDNRPSPIPRDIPKDRLLFSTRRYVNNGRISDITHVVYIDPESFAGMDNRSQRESLIQAVGQLNALLPKRQFILMGPGKWGGLKDNPCSIPVTYSDIGNCAALVEMVNGHETGIPDLSFGTSFFQDLVETNIRYLPIFPAEEGCRFDALFFKRSPNLLADLLPEYADLSDTLRLIDIPKTTEGLALQILMNADLDEAVALLTEPSKEGDYPENGRALEEGNMEYYWRWRQSMAEQIASQLDAERFGVKGLYLFGSTKNGTAGPGSDIDLLVHFQGTEEQCDALLLWLEGWSMCLDEMNYMQTGYRSKGLLDVHLVTDEDIQNKTSYAVKINAVTDAARPMKINEPRSITP